MPTKRIYNWHTDKFEYVEVQESNGNLVYVENENGEGKWVTQQEIEE